jgi:Icc-related predicted phosphoesterase
VKLVLISDTHTFHNQVQVPDGDVLVHAGDMGLRGSFDEIQSCLTWLNGKPHKHVVAIAGNHDWAFARPDTKGYLDLGRINYLENSCVNIDGKNFYGSPVQPWFCDWAFNVQRGPEIKKYWDMIPDAGLVDVLITHGPPRGILDQAAPHRHSDCLGCDDLFKKVEISKPLVHVFGHIHGGYGQTQFGSGTKFFNASVVNEAYQVVNKPWVVEI